MRERPLESLGWPLLAIAFLPLGSFAYLGQFSRLMSDDYCAVAVGRDLGAWQGTLYWFNNWAGSYANFFLKSVIAPLDVLLPRFMPAIIILIWLLGAIWLVRSASKTLGFHPRRPSAILAASLLVTASLNGFYSPQSYYWFAASTHYALPLALLTVYLALCAHVQQASPDARVGLWAVAGAILCFLTAGASEIFVAFQLTLLTLCLAPIIAFWRSDKLRGLAVVVGAGWFGTFVGFLLQLSSPGLATRAAVDAARFGHAIRDASDLLAVTLSRTFQHVGHPPAFAGFMLLFAVSFLHVRFSYRSLSSGSASEPPQLATRALGIGLAFQLLWAPALWRHASDDALFFGRFSAGYLLIVVLNLIMIIGYLVAIQGRDRLNQWLSEGRIHNLTVVNLLLFAVTLLFVMTQLRSIHYRAATFLFTSALSLLYVGAGQLRAAVDLPVNRRLRWLSLFAPGVALLSLSAIVFTALFGRGFVDARVLAPAAFLLVAPGLLWGSLYGVAYCQIRQSTRGGTGLATRLSLTLVITITFGILIGNTRLIPSFQSYARDWDARHQLILSLAEDGRRSVEVAPLAFDLADFVGVTTLGRDPSNRCALRYYDLYSIAVAEP